MASLFLSFWILIETFCCLFVILNIVMLIVEDYLACTANISLIIYSYFLNLCRFVKIYDA